MLLLLLPWCPVYSLLFGHFWNVCCGYNRWPYSGGILYYTYTVFGSVLDALADVFVVNESFLSIMRLFDLIQAWMLCRYDYICAFSSWFCVLCG